MIKMNTVFDVVHSPVNLEESWSLIFLQKIYVKNYNIELTVK